VFEMRGLLPILAGLVESSRASTLHAQALSLALRQAIFYTDSLPVDNAVCAFGHGVLILAHRRYLRFV